MPFRSNCIQDTGHFDKMKKIQIIKHSGKTTIKLTIVLQKTRAPFKASHVNQSTNFEGVEGPGQGVYGCDYALTGG